MFSLICKFWVIVCWGFAGVVMGVNRVSEGEWEIVVENWGGGGVWCWVVLGRYRGASKIKGFIKNKGICLISQEILGWDYVAFSGELLLLAIIEYWDIDWLLRFINTRWRYSYKCSYFHGFPRVSESPSLRRGTRGVWGMSFARFSIRKSSRNRNAEN